MLMEPPIDKLIEKSESKYALVVALSKRARTLESKEQEMLEEELENWLADPAELGRKPAKIEYTASFEDEDGIKCMIFKFKKSFFGKWLLGIVSESGTFSEMKEYNSATETENAKVLLHILKEYEKNNKNRIIYVEKENGGLSDARNHGLKYATGDFIAFLDSDDYIEKNAYEEMYNKAIEENADYVECDFIWEFPNKIRVDKQYPYKNKKEMLSFVRVVAWNKLIKRQLITDNNLEFPKGLRYEDVEFTYKLIPFGR